MGRKIITPPTHISSEHILSEFSSDNHSLDVWLKKRALQNEINQTSRTFVICEDNKVIGYYALAAGSVTHDIAESRIRRNTPNPIPVVVLGRLAIDKEWQGNGLGRALVRDAILRTLQAAKFLGIRAVLVHALNEKAGKFYKDCGFRESPIDDLTLMLPLSEAESIISSD
jgi:GNAT superfamily N-acetyltransferase